MNMARPARELTGRKVLFITLSAFGVIIGVNLAMAYFAINTFPGLEVRNSYVASQGFNDRLARQTALGWSSEASLRDNELRIVLTTEDGMAAPVREITALLGRPTTEREDFTPDLRFDGRAWVTQVDIDHGNWDLRLSAIAGDGTEFSQRIGLIHR